ncbi:hypothetical protein [Chromobacterium amazonense]|uniref:ABC transmembrane type-1 domain-containing protein n=1 Tax=Chromobacterium amazonense TaxID=1382803 RepID=A0ABU8V6S8_9NEIS|nr:hypothetical protein [Chromobacterium amazonense]MDQ4541199.1 hypothetical protein [Chromobacterium amazonense]
MNNITSPSDKLKLAAISIPFFIILFFVLPLWLMFSSSDSMVFFYKCIVFASILIGFFYYIAGLVIKPPIRVFSIAVVNAFSIWLYAIFPFGFLSLGYLIFVPHNIVFLILASAFILIVAMLWVAIKLAAFKRIFLGDGLIEKNLIVSESYIMLKRSFSIDLTPSVVPTDSLLSKYLAKGKGKIVAVVSVLVPAGYAISQISNRLGAVDMTVLFLSLLSYGLTLHIWGKMACSTYFHFFVIRGLERKYNKPLIVNF